MHPETFPENPSCKLVSIYLFCGTKVKMQFLIIDVKILESIGCKVIGRKLPGFLFESFL